MSILILVLAIVSLIILCINICTDYECSDFLKCELPLFVLSVTIVLSLFNMLFEFDPDDLYNPKENDVVVIKCTNVNNDNVKYTCKIANENGPIGKRLRFVDDIGKYNIGDTIMFNKKSVRHE